MATKRTETTTDMNLCIVTILLAVPELKSNTLTENRLITTRTCQFYNNGDAERDAGQGFWRHSILGAPTIHR